jgi:ABC-type branched-subunit amino acid transport system substrate-binding protein
MRSKWRWLLAAACVLALLAGACTEDTADEGGGSDDSSPEEASEPFEPSGLLVDDGPCDPELEPYPLGIMTVFESQILSLIDQVQGAEASVEAFNGRGGVGGHCMELQTCDTQLDANGEVACARDLVDAGVVATLHDTTAANPEGVVGVTEPAGLPRIGIAPGTQELSASNSFPIGGGSSGTTFMMAPLLAQAGHKNIAVIHVDTPQVQALPGAMADLLEANDAEIVEMIPVPAGTTDYQQFVLAAEDAGADGVMLALGEGEALQVLDAAEQLDSDLVFSASLGTFGQSDAEDLGDFAGNMLFNSEVPPATASQDEWPILADVVNDLEASGEPNLQRSEIKASAVRSWLAVYALTEAVEQFGDPDDVSREGITAALEAAQEIDFFGLIPPWTPSAGTGEGIFGTVSNPYYYQVSFDPDAGEWVISDTRLNLVEESLGNTDYEQPPAG